MSKEFTGKVVLVTGASSGIGATTAISFSKLGASVALTGRNLENLKKIGKQCDGDYLLVQADVNKEEDVKKIIDEVIKKYGRLDVLVNNAGVFENGGLLQTDVNQFDRIFKTNVRSVYYLTNLATPYLIKTKGNIVNVSSIAGYRSFQGTLAYCMSKSALDQFTKCISLELAPKQVRVNGINPGVVDTDIFNRSGMTEQEVKNYMERCKETHPIGRIGEPQEVADLIIFLAGDKAKFITGDLIPIDGGRHNATHIVQKSK